MICLYMYDSICLRWIGIFEFQSSSVTFYMFKYIIYNRKVNLFCKYFVYDLYNKILCYLLRSSFFEDSRYVNVYYGYALCCCSNTQPLPFERRKVSAHTVDGRTKESMSVPVFTFQLKYDILPGLVTVGKYDGSHSCLTAATTGAKVPRKSLIQCWKLNGHQRV